MSSSSSSVGVKNLGVEIQNKKSKEDEIRENERRHNEETERRGILEGKGWGSGKRKSFLRSSSALPHSCQPSPHNGTRTANVGNEYSDEETHSNDEDESARKNNGDVEDEIEPPPPPPPPSKSPSKNEFIYRPHARSTRLVEYFIVVSSKARIRKRKIEVHETSVEKEIAGTGRKIDLDTESQPLANGNANNKATALSGKISPKNSSFFKKGEISTEVQQSSTPIASNKKVIDASFVIRRSNDDDIADNQPITNKIPSASPKVMRRISSRSVHLPGVSSGVERRGSAIPIVPVVSEEGSGVTKDQTKISLSFPKSPEIKSGIKKTRFKFLGRLKKFPPPPPATAVEKADKCQGLSTNVKVALGLEKLKDDGGKAYGNNQVLISPLSKDEVKSNSDRVNANNSNKAMASVTSSDNNHSFSSHHPSHVHPTIGKEKSPQNDQSFQETYDSSETESFKELSGASSSRTGGDISENIHMPQTGDEGAWENSRIPRHEIYFQPEVTTQYPLVDHVDNPLNPMIKHFCFPNNEVIFLTPVFQMPHIHHFVLTNDKGKKMFGTCLTIYEEFQPPDDKDMTEEEYEALAWYKSNRGKVHSNPEEGDNIEVTLTSTGKIRALYLPKVLCLLSAWPYLHAFREYLSQLYRLATMTNLMTVPIERYILNVCEEIPPPPPGSFKLQLKILNSTIQMWAPPANQPIPYVSLPFGRLFECLEIHNIIYIWYALTLERKILLVSSQSSLITVCAEILCSLLFPMQWSHLYIPVLPRFLSPMLDAPMPYLCGINRENFPFAIGSISDETIVVDLDQNVITMGDGTIELPPIPLKRRTKLETTLEDNVGKLFWNARGLHKNDLQTLNEEDDEMELDTLTKTGNDVWKEKLQGFDEAFNLAYTPNSSTLLNGEISTSSNKSSILKDDFDDNKQSNWDAVQESFLRFYVTMLKDYRRFLTPLSNKVSSTRWSGNRDFQMEEFISSQQSDVKPFLQELCETQQFDDFITKRIYSPHEADVIFFDESITAKSNRSKMTIKKKKTTFLHSSNAHKALSTIEAVEPNSDGLHEQNPTQMFNLLDNLYATPSDENIVTKTYEYTCWPEKFDPSLFGQPRPLPSIIASEFDRQALLSLRLSENNLTALHDEFKMGDCHPHPEVAIFTVFFVCYGPLIGLKLSNLNQRQLNEVEYEDHSFKSVHTDNNIESDCCDYLPGWPLNICPMDAVMSGLSELVGGDSKDEVEKPLEYLNKTQQEPAIESNVKRSKIIAKTELDLAFSTLDMMIKRKLVTDPDAYKSLMLACKRCGSTTHATQLMVLLREDGLLVDREMYSLYLGTYSMSKIINPHLTIECPLTNILANDIHQRDGLSKQNQNHHWKYIRRKIKSSPSTAFCQSYHPADRIDNLSDVGSSVTSIACPANDASSMCSSLLSLDYSKRNQRKSSVKKKKIKLREKDKLVTTIQVKKQNEIGDNLLHNLYKDLVIITNSNCCPKCSQSLSEDDVILGWESCSVENYATKCLQCKQYFIPHFIIKSTTSSFVGSQGLGTPLYCDFLSPWVLRKLLHAATKGGDEIEVILDPKWRDGTGISATIWWNLIISFKRYKLPITFLLQGSFGKRLIIPVLDW